MQRYGRALDRLAKDTGPRLRSCSAGVWEGRPRTKAARGLSLAYLSQQVIETCELARRQPAVKVLSKRLVRRQITSRDAEKAVKAARRLAKIARKWDAYLWPTILMSTKPWLSAAAASPPKGLSEAHKAAWLDTRRHRPILATEFADALDALARVLDEEKPTRRKSGGHIGGPARETQLARDLSGLIRFATIGGCEPKAAQWPYQYGTLLPRTGGWPAMASVAAFVQAVFELRDDDANCDPGVLRNRLSALDT